MKTITLSQLEENGASYDHLKSFKEVCGESIEINTKLCESVASLLDFYWLAERFLTKSGLAEFTRATKNARSGYENALSIGWSMTRKSEQIRTRAVYNRVMARTFAELYLKQDESKS